MCDTAGKQWKQAKAVLSGGSSLARSLARSKASLSTGEDAIHIIDIGSAIAARINPKLAPEDRHQLEYLLLEFQDVFAFNPKRPTRNNICKHVIYVGDTQPIKQRPRRTPPAWKREINEQIDEMLQNGIFRRSNSPWSSNVVFVKKKDGSTRFAINYRLLNDATKKDAYPIPDTPTISGSRRQNSKLPSFQFQGTPTVLRIGQLLSVLHTEHGTIGGAFKQTNS